MTQVNMIVAADLCNAIGCRGGIPWHIPEDFRYFKRITLGHTVIMGYMTWLSLGSKPLPGRRNIIISLEPAQTGYPEAVMVHSLEEALQMADGEVFIIGGGYTYREALPLASRIYLTRVHTKVPEADTYFPELPEAQWRIASRSEKGHDGRSGLDYEFLVYERI